MEKDYISLKNVEPIAGLYGDINNLVDLTTYMSLVLVVWGGVVACYDEPYANVIGSILLYSSLINLAICFILNYRPALRILTIPGGLTALSGLMLLLNALRIYTLGKLSVFTYMLAVGVIYMAIRIFILNNELNIFYKRNEPSEIREWLLFFHNIMKSNPEKNLDVVRFRGNGDFQNHYLYVNKCGENLLMMSKPPKYYRVLPIDDIDFLEKGKFFLGTEIKCEITAEKASAGSYQIMKETVFDGYLTPKQFDRFESWL